ncbi:hypothetical protein NEUTE2DRAFT_135812 [Neurospora tetrasperma FGSC 2509]|nr:hypothetical protein NEUTE2DRAFT_135812 [Neurospora tetrasperma FGSC 2509]
MFKDQVCVIQPAELIDLSTTAVKCLQMRDFTQSTQTYEISNLITSYTNIISTIFTIEISSDFSSYYISSGDELAPTFPPLLLPLPLPCLAYTRARAYGYIRPFITTVRKTRSRKYNLTLIS